MAVDRPSPIITCALTGGAHTKADWPNLPEQPDEIVEQGIAAWEAGAAVLHIHARDADGSNTTNIEIYREIHFRLCAETDAIVQLTTGGGLDHTYQQRIATALLSPEMCSLNMGFALFFDRDGRGMMLSNPRPQIEWFAREMLERGVKPEYEIYNATMIEELERLIESGLAPEPLNLGLVLGTAAQGGARGTWENLTDMVRRVPAGANVDVIAIGRAQLPLTTMGLAMGLGIRVGLEDNVRYSRTELARDNAQLVERAVRIARELQVEPATPAQARERLGTRGREAGAIPAAIVAAETPVVSPPRQLIRYGSFGGCDGTPIRGGGIMGQELFDKGLEIRREVLGAEYVDRSLAGADDFSRPFQELVTEYCWGAAWGGEALSRRDRSLLNLVMLGALGRADEFKLHLRGALTNGCSRDEIRETLIQLAVYAGVPAGVEAFRLARQVFAAEDETSAAGAPARA